jgi:hypothetical protein
MYIRRIWEKVSFELNIAKSLLGVTRAEIEDIALSSWIEKLLIEFLFPV